MAYDQNQIDIFPVNLGEEPEIVCVGDDVNIDMNLQLKGATSTLRVRSGFVVFQNIDGDDEVLVLSNTAGAVNAFYIDNALSGAGPILSAIGETNVDINLNPAGTGRVKENGVAVVLGATGSTDNALVRADGTGTKTIQGGTNMPTVDDSGNLTVGQKATLDGIVAYGAAGLLTIASGVITATKSYHKVGTEAAAATDDLDVINGGVDGMVLILRANNSGRTVVVKNGTGNIVLDAILGDFSLDNTADLIELLYDSSLSTWQELRRSNNGL